MKILSILFWGGGREKSERPHEKDHALEMNLQGGVGY